MGESRRQIAESFADASLAYANNPTALHLRAMNMLFEGFKEKGAMIIVPSSALDTSLSGMAALSQTSGERLSQWRYFVAPLLSMTCSRDP